MLAYIVRRILILPIIMAIVTFVLFFLIMQLPIEQRVAVYLPSMSADTFFDPEKARALIDNTIEKHGLNDPFHTQYIRWVKRLIVGDWGFSPTWRQPVLEGILARVPATAELALAAFISSIILALILGGLAGRYQGKWPDHLIQTMTFVLWAFPSFILGLILLNLLYAWNGWFPPGRLSISAGPIVDSEFFINYTGMYTFDALINGNFEILWDAIRHLILPVITLAGAQWALLTRIMRSSIIDTLTQDYIKTARAKGLPEERVLSPCPSQCAVTVYIHRGCSCITASQRDRSY